MRLTRPWSAREQRLTLKGVFGNIKNVAEGSIQEHIIQPTMDGNIPKAAIGLPIAAFDIVTTAPDAAVAGLPFVDQDIEPLPAQTGARTRRDVKLTLDNALTLPVDLLTFRFEEAAKDVVRGGLSAVRLVGDVPVDTLDAMGGYDLVDRRRAQARQSLDYALAP